MKSHVKSTDDRELQDVSPRKMRGECVDGLGEYEEGKDVESEHVRKRQDFRPATITQPRGHVIYHYE